jgi:hypothetical protein
MPATGSVQLDVKVVPTVVTGDTVPGEQDGDTVVAWMREGAYEIENAHRVLDAAGFPRLNPDTDRPFTLAARIHYALTNEGKASPVTTVAVHLDNRLIAESVAQVVADEIARP